LFQVRLKDTTEFWLLLIALEYALQDLPHQQYSLILEAKQWVVAPVLVTKNQTDPLAEQRPISESTPATGRHRQTPTLPTGEFIRRMKFVFPDQFLLPKPGKFQALRLHNTAQFPRLLVRQQQRAFVKPNHKR